MSPKNVFFKEVNEALNEKEERECEMGDPGLDWRDPGLDSSENFRGLCGLEVSIDRVGKRDIDFDFDIPVLELSILDMGGKRDMDFEFPKLSILRSSNGLGGSRESEDEWSKIFLRDPDPFRKLLDPDPLREDPDPLREDPDPLRKDPDPVREDPDPRLFICEG